MGADFSKSLNDGFAKEVVQLPTYLLDDAVNWIQSCLEPVDVFTDEQLRDWARNNGFTEES